MHLALDIEDVGVGLVESAQLSKQTPIVDLLGHLHNLVVGCGVPLYILEEPGREQFGGLVHSVAADGVEVEDEGRVAQVSHGAQGAGDGGVKEFNIARLALLSIWGGNVEVGELSMVLLEPVGALVLSLLVMLGLDIR